MKFLDDVAEKEDLGLSLNRQTRYGTNKTDYVIEFEYWSDLGEDCIITLVVSKLTKKEIIKAMEDYAECFDAEENATMWYDAGKNNKNLGVPTSLRDLLKDSDEQQEKLNHIVETMKKLK